MNKFQKGHLVSYISDVIIGFGVVMVIFANQYVLGILIAIGGLILAIYNYFKRVKE